MEKLNSVEKAKIFDALDWSDICHKYEHRDPSILAKDFIKSTIEAQTGLSISTAAFYTRIRALINKLEIGKQLSLSMLKALTLLKYYRLNNLSPFITRAATVSLVSHHAIQS